MLEKHRLTYLDVLGIENYMPRYQLAGALPSQLLSDDALREPTAFSTADIQNSNTENSTKSESVATDDVPHNHLPQDVHEKQTDAYLSKSELSKAVSPVIADVMSSLGMAPKTNSHADPSTSLPSGEESSTASSTKENIQQSSDQPEVKPATHQTEIRFSLNIWRIKNDILVIDSREPAAALPTEKLLQNILRSIGFPMAQLPPSDLLRWPLFSSKKFVNKKFTRKQPTEKNINQSNVNQDSVNQGGVNQSSEEDEARAMVQAYLSAQCSRAPINTLLLLGKSATSFALTPASNEDVDIFYEKNKGKAVNTSIWEGAVLVAPSLVEMLHEPMKKRITWQALQTLFVE